MPMSGQLLIRKPKTGICLTSTLTCYSAGAIGLEGPILAHDLREMTVGTKTSELFCLTIFGLCQWPDVDTSFTLDLGTKPDTSRPVSSGEAPIQVVHISDIHVEFVIPSPLLGGLTTTFS
jgi:hypothetical protein